MNQDAHLGDDNASPGTEAFGALLREYRLRTALTQESLAERAGLSPRSVQDLERGIARPRSATVARILASLALGDDEAARLRAAAAARPRTRTRTQTRLRHNLPLQRTSFIGREAQLAELVPLLETTRLLTLTGVGGVGKTRLALHLAQRTVATFRDGVWLADLAPVMDPQLVTRSIADALAIRETRGQRLRESLRAALKFRQMLLILDNCEHLLRTCADLTVGLLLVCPELRVLATSREPLGVSGEVVYPVPPLCVHSSLALDARALCQSEAGQLLIARTQARQPGFRITERNTAAIAQLCRQLDGIPLALELVAPRLAALGPEQLLPRLMETVGTISNVSIDAAPRQTTLSATIQWSYELLTEPERVLFRRLAVFVGTWTLQDAEAVCGETRSIDFPTVLSSLVEKSLVVVEQAEPEPRRYRILEVVRQFAAGVLETDGEAVGLRDRHASYFASVAERLQPQPGPPERGAIDIASREYPNLLAALDWLIECGKAEAGVRLGAALVNFWIDRGHLTVGLDRIEQLLRLHSTPTGASYGAALRAAGRLAWARGDYHARLRFAEQSLAVFRQVDDEVGVGLSLQDLTSVAIQHGEYDGARELAYESLRLWEKLGDRGRVARSQLALGHLARNQGQFAAALAAYEAALAGAANRAQYGNIVTHMGWLALYSGDLERARMLAEAGRLIACELGELREAAVCLTLLGKIAFASGDQSAAWTAFADSLSVHVAFDNEWGATVAVEGIAQVAAEVPDLAARALRIASAACDLRIAMGRPLSPVEQMELDRGLSPARQRLSTEAQLLACAEARTLSLTEAVAEALDLLTCCREAKSVALDQSISLSRREGEVAILIARGLTNREIANNLVVSVRTAETYVERILNKLGFHARSQVAAWVSEQHFAL